MNAQEFFLPSQTVNMNDVLTTVAAVMAGVVAWRQKAKDEQLKSRDDTIAFLKEQIAYLQSLLEKK